jgi:NADPH-dependent 2,4-dienoyl-CoA reductase/sulfur reductase-like enzyme
MDARPRVVVVGAGFAGLETLFCLRHQLGDGVDLSLVSNDKNFVFRPDTIHIPFGADPKRSVVPLTRPLANTGVKVFRPRSSRAPSRGCRTTSAASRASTSTAGGFPARTASSPSAT